MALDPTGCVTVYTYRRREQKQVEKKVTRTMLQFWKTGSEGQRKVIFVKYAVSDFMTHIQGRRNR